MTASTATCGSALRFKAGWLFSPQYDVAFFCLPVLFGALVLTCGKLFLVPAAITFLFGEFFPFLGNFHAGATLFHYSDSKNRQHYFSTGKNLVIFLIAPLAIILLSIASPYWSLVFIPWTVQHLTQQNVGILLLYHDREDACVSRKLEARTLQIPALFFLAVYIVRLSTDGPLYIIIASVAVLYTAALTIYYLSQLFDQGKKGRAINAPALIFWLISVWFFAPILFVGKLDFLRAILLPLIVHWCQYIGLNYLLVKRKYKADEANVQRLPTRHAIWLFLVICSLTSLIVLSCQNFAGSTDSAFLRNLFGGFVLGFSSMHYFLDAFVWRFRETYPRESLLPYLKSASMRAELTRASLP